MTSQVFTITLGHADCREVDSFAYSEAEVAAMLADCEAAGIAGASVKAHSSQAAAEHYASGLGAW